MKVREEDPNLDQKKSSLAADNETNNESKISDFGTPNFDGSIFGIPESKEVDKILKVNTGGSTIETSQKDAGGKRITPKAKNQEVLAQRDQVLEHCKREKKHSYS